MEKKRVRIYRAQEGGDTSGFLSNFIEKAQYGQQQQQVDPQQVVTQVATLMAPLEQGGQGANPEDIYMQLASSYGEDVANQILTAATNYLNESGIELENTQAAVNQEDIASNDLSAQEDLIEEERQRQMMMQDQAFAEEDDTFMDELFYGNAKKGGALDKAKKQFIKSSMKLAKKSLGDAGKSENFTADSTDIDKGRAEKSNNFLSGIKNNVNLFTAQQEAERQAEEYFTPQNFMNQYGGFTDQNSNLYKFIYGGNDPSVPELTMAQNGIDIGTGNYDPATKTITATDGTTRVVDDEEAAWITSQMQFGNKPSNNQSTNSAQNAFLAAGNLAAKSNQGYYPNYVPYSTDNFFSSVFPYNRSKHRIIPGAPRHVNAPGLPFTGSMFSPDMTGFSHTKERLGPGAFKHTYRSLYDQPESSDNTYDLDKDRRGMFNKDPDRQGMFSNFGEKANLNFQRMFNREGKEASPTSINKKGFLKGFLNKKAQEGFQQENNIQINPELRPRTSQEAWANAYPEIKQDWGSITNADDLLRDTEMDVFDIKERDLEQNLNYGFAGVDATTQKAKRLNRKMRKALAEQKDASSDNLNATNYYTDPGVWAVNSGNFIEGIKPGSPNSQGFEGIVKYGGYAMAQGGTAYPQKNGSLQTIPTAMGGGAANQYKDKESLEVRDSISRVARGDANLEAEGGETAYGDVNGDGFPEHYKITGPRHSSGGVPLNLPDGTFIYSDTRSMKISDCNILKMFNKPCNKGGYTPADLAKQYDINKYRQILQDPNTDNLEKKTAELMIKQFTFKLGALALAQESKKGFPQGIPEVARPYMEAMGIKDEDLLPKDPNATEGTPQEMDMAAMTSEEGMPAEDQMMEQPMAMYGMEMGGYDMPFAQETPMEIFQRGGRLDKYQDKGEVKKSTKVYNKTDLPENAVIKTEKDAWNIQPGDFVLQADGSYRKVLTSGFNPQKVAVDSGTQKQTVQDFIIKSPENKQIIDQANAIIENAITQGKAVRGYKDAKGKFIEDKTKNGVKLLGNLDLPFKDRIILSRALNSNPDFGTDKYKILFQSYTPGYQGKGAFVAGFSPEDYEKRFIFEKARGAGNSDDEAFAVVDQVYADPKLKAKFRKDYITMLGVPNIPTTDEELLKPDFYKTRYKDVTLGMENVLSKNFARPAIGDDALSGFEHFDAFGFSPELKYEYSPGELEDTNPDGTMTPVNIPVPQYAPWWLQDQLSMANAFSTKYSRTDQYPESFGVNYETAQGPYLDPTLELAQIRGSAGDAISALRSFAGPQSLYSGAAGIFGKAADAASATLSNYNDKNILLARQDIGQNLAIRNKESEARRIIAQELADSTNRLLARKSNTAIADNKNISDTLKSAITNRYKTDAVNQMTPEFNVDPSVGGKVYRTATTRDAVPTKGSTLKDKYQEYFDLTGDKESATKLAMLDYNKSLGNTSAGSPDAMMALYDNRQFGGLTKGLNALKNLQSVKNINSLGQNLGLGRFIGSESNMDNLVRPINSSQLIPMESLDYSNLNNYQDLMNIGDLMPDYKMPVQESGFGALFKDIQPLRPRLDSKILTSEQVNPLGFLKTNAIGDDIVYLVAKKKEAGLPLDINEEQVLIIFKDKVDDLLKNPPAVSKEQLETITPAPDQKGPVDITELNEISQSFYKLPYSDISDSQKLSVIAQRDWNKSNIKGTDKPAAAKKKLSSKKKTDEAPAEDLLLKTKNEIAMQNYNTPYDELTGLAKKMVDNEAMSVLSKKTNLQYGGMYVGDYNTYPFINF